MHNHADAGPLIPIKSLNGGEKKKKEVITLTLALLLESDGQV